MEMASVTVASANASRSSVGRHASVQACKPIVSHPTQNRNRMYALDMGHASVISANAIPVALEVFVKVHQGMRR